METLRLRHAKADASPAARRPRRLPQHARAFARVRGTGHRGTISDYARTRGAIEMAGRRPEGRGRVRGNSIQIEIDDGENLWRKCATPRCRGSVYSDSR